jgi:hypothetical protein
VSPITTMRLTAGGSVGSGILPTLSRAVACATRASQIRTGNAASGTARESIVTGVPSDATIGQAASGATTARTESASPGTSSTHGGTC